MVNKEQKNGVVAIVTLTSMRAQIRNSTTLSSTQVPYT